MPPATFDNTLTITTRAGRPTLWLEVVYDGTRAPKALFDDLRMIGFDPPTEMPPPSSAMDWSNPDVSSGRPYSVKPHRIEATIDPPIGTGPKRSWTSEERSVYEISLQGVLRRHGIDGLLVGNTVVIPDPVAERAPESQPAMTLVAPPPPAAPLAAAPLVSVESHDNEPEVVGFGESVSAPTPQWYRLAITSRLASPEDLSSVMHALREAGLATKLGRIETYVEVKFRGSVQTNTRFVAAVESICDHTQDAQVVAILASVGIGPELVTIERAPAKPSDLAAFLMTLTAPAGSGPTGTAPTGSGLAAAEGHPSLATVIAVFDPRRRSMIDDALNDMGVVDCSYSATERAVTTRYRASEHIVMALATRVEALVHPGAAGATVALLTRLGGLDASDDAQIRVVPPTAKVADTGATLAAEIDHDPATPSKGGRSKRRGLRLVG